MAADGAQAPTRPSDASPTPAAVSAHTLLQLWLSPSFPVGAYAYSHGLEKAAENGWITTSAQLHDWLADLIELGALGNDMILLAQAWHALRAGNGAQVDANLGGGALRSSGTTQLAGSAGAGTVAVDGGFSISG